MLLTEPINCIPDHGYATIRNILSDRVAVLFSVTDHEWNRLVWSSEWKAFQVLLEKSQEEYTQRQR